MMETLVMIKNTIKEKIKTSDWKLIIPYLILTGIGIFMVYSSSSYFAMTVYSNSERFFVRQLFFSVLGFVIVAFISVVNNRLLKSKKIISFSLTVIFSMLLYLIVVRIATGGENATNGASGWLNIGTFGLQPTEFLKMALILYLSVFFSNTQIKLATIDDYYDQTIGKKGKTKQLFSRLWNILKKPVLLTVVFLGLIVLQPDMGTVIIVVFICLIMLFLSGLSFRYGLISLGGMGIVYSLFVGVFKLWGNIPFLPAYMVQRFTAFLDPFSDVQKSSYQLVNSFYALSRGGLFGVGIGESVQKTGYLPESYTDFIIPIMGEELGLFFVLGTLAVFFYLVYRIFRMSMRIRDPFGQLVCIGVASMFLIQGTINVGGAVGLLPLTGVTFPFVSYGGSSMLVSSIAIGIINNIYINDKKEKIR